MVRQMIEVAAALTVVASLACAPQDAAAAIECNEGFQIIEKNAYSTPYCQDAYLAEVARLYGVPVSDAAIRNPGMKSRVCELIGHDNRARQACANFRLFSPGGANRP